MAEGVLGESSSIVGIGVSEVIDGTTIVEGTGLAYVLMEAGHMSQNLLLLATGLGMASLAVGGYVDSKITELLNLELVKEVPLYMIVVGGYV